MGSANNAKVNFLIGLGLIALSKIAHQACHQAMFLRGNGGIAYSYGSIAYGYGGFGRGHKGGIVCLCP